MEVRHGQNKWEGALAFKDAIDMELDWQSHGPVTFLGEPGPQ